MFVTPWTATPKEACSDGRYAQDVMRPSTPREFLDDAERAAIEGEIAEAERKTSAEIRVHLERKVEGSVFNWSGRKFEALGMKKTAARNGVLIVLAIENREFAILGDQGINSRVEKNFWDDARDAMATCFRNDDFAGGLRAGVRCAGEKLALHFPRAATDTNELADAISCSD